MATRWNVYFDGGVQSGEQAAMIVLVEFAMPEPACEPPGTRGSSR